jgi:hypothetical protein
MEDTEMIIVEDNNFLECPEESWHEQAVEQAVPYFSNGRILPSFSYEPF